MRKLSKITESVWTDIHKRSTGETVRKEDDVNNMDIYRFVDYLDELYDTNGRIGIGESEESIYIPIFRLKDSAVSGWPMWVILHNYYSDKEIIFSNKHFGTLCNNFFNRLRDKFAFCKNKDHFLKIVPENDKGITNLFFISVIDTIIGIMDSDRETILIKKK